MKSPLSTVVLLVATIFSSITLGKELVQSDKLRQLLDKSNLVDGANLLQSWAFATPERNRGFGGTAHKKTVDYLYEEATKYGYDVYKQSFKGNYTATISVTGSFNGADLKLGSFRGSPSTPGAITGKLAVAFNLGCWAADFPVSVAGKIVLIMRGICGMSDKVALAYAAGASAVLIINTDDTPLVSVFTPSPELVPTASISNSTGAEIISKLASDPTATITLDLQYLLEERITHNVIAQTKDGDPNNVIMLGGHTDSIPEGPGINDDGSGTLAILEIMKALSQFNVNNAIRFTWWSAEEFGLLGSNYFIVNLTPEERSKIKLYINLDVIASSNYVYGITDGDGSVFPPPPVGPPGSGEVEKAIQDYFTNVAKKPYIAMQLYLGSTDYTGPIEAGIAFGDIYSGSDEIKTEDQIALFGGTAGVALDPNFHTAGDTVDNCNVDAWIENTKAAAHIIAISAQSLDYLKGNSTSTTQTRRSRIPEGHLGKLKSKRGIFAEGTKRASCGHSEGAI